MEGTGRAETSLPVLARDKEESTQLPQNEEREDKNLSVSPGAVGFPMCKERRDPAAYALFCHEANIILVNDTRLKIAKLRSIFEAEKVINRKVSVMPV